MGLSDFEKISIHPIKETWFRLQGKYRFLIDIKQKLLYTKRRAWWKIKFAISVTVSVILIIYALNPTLLNDTTHRWLFIIVNIIGVLKEPF